MTKSMLFAVVMFLPTSTIAYDMGRGEAACPLKGKEALVLDVTLDEMHVVLLPEGIRATLPTVSAVPGDSNPFPVLMAATVTGAHIVTGGEGDQSWFGVNWGHAVMCWGSRNGVLKETKDAEKEKGRLVTPAPLPPVPSPAAPSPMAKVSTAAAPPPPAAPPPQIKPPQAKRVHAKPRPWVRHRPRPSLVPPPS
jgi:hypothetical protein